MTAACPRILEKYDVVGLITVTLEREGQTRTVTAQRGRPSNHTPPPPPRCIEEGRYKVSKIRSAAQALAPRLARLGWRAYAPNAQAQEWSLEEVVLA